MQIGNVLIPNNVFLAPMAGITDLPFRLICKQYGAGMVYSEMVSAKGIMYDNENTKTLLRVDKDEHPMAVQLFGSDPQILSGMAAKISESEFDIVDINMGCPAPKIVKNGEGSALMKNPELIGRIVKAVSGATEKPVTVKIRKGFNEKWLNAVEIAKIAEENGAKAIAVHGRTREQYYSGAADWEVIQRVKEAVSIPVIGNGDVASPELAEKMLRQTGCDAVMIGRAAEGNPWIFRRTLHYLATGELLDEPGDEERIAAALEHAESLMRHKGAYIGLLEMRKHLCWYIKGIKGAGDARVKINTSESFDETKSILANLLN